ncbi:MAG: alpha/beta hydrolase [Verrucomicrobia bacterium]|nr:alpha/beta hydrolase [Verrucomicrobiota bacterium]
MPSSAYHHIFEPATKPAAPPLLLLHGTGGSEQDLLRLGRAVSPGSALLSPRGDVSEGGALRFFARLGEGVFDPAEVTRRTNALADFVLAAARRYAIDARQLIAVGFSNGANIAATLMQLRPETLGGGILFRAMVVLDQPAAPASLAGRRVLIVNGSVDPIVPADHPARLAALLRAGDAEVKVHPVQASHQLTSQDAAAAQEWLQRMTATPAKIIP